MQKVRDARGWVITTLPEGYNNTKLLSQGEKVYKKGRNYITPDQTSHIGGVWKMFDDVKNLNKTSKEARVGTYDANLIKIGD